MKTKKLHNFFHVFALICLGGLSASCVEEMEQAGSTELVPQGELFSIEATADESPDTKLAFGENLTSVHWEAQDRLSVLVKSQEGTLTNAAGFRKATGTNSFEGSFNADQGPAATGTNTWYALYPYHVEVGGIKPDNGKSILANQANSAFQLHISNAPQTGINNMDHVHPPLFGRGTAEGGTAPVIKMDHLAAILEINLRNNSAQALKVSKVKVSIDGERRLSGDFRINVDNSATLASKSSNLYTELEVREALVEPAAVGAFYLMIPRTVLDVKSKCTFFQIDVTTDQGTVSLKKDIHPAERVISFLPGHIYPIYVDQGVAPQSSPAIEELLGLLDLNHPGLEEVRKLYGDRQYYSAAYALLQYYRNRTSVTVPGVDLQNPPLNKEEPLTASNALRRNGYRFLVQNGYFSFQGQDGNIEWRKNNDSFNDEQFKQKHRHQWMLAMAKNYAKTKEEVYVTDWIDTYRSWLNVFPYKPGKLKSTNTNTKRDDQYQAWIELQPAERLISQLEMMWYFLPSANFTPQWLAEFLTAMVKTARNILANPYGVQNSNIYLAQRQALAELALILPEFKEAEGWKAAVTEIFGEQLRLQFNEDGVQNEEDPSYHMGVMNNIREVYLLADANGLIPSVNDIDRFHKGADFLADVVWPDCTIDNFNDTRSAQMTPNVIRRNLGYYAELFPEDVGLKWMAAAPENRKGLTAPDALVKRYDYSGWYMMKTGWNPEDMMLILKNNKNPGNKKHCQFDNGTFSVYRNGRCFTPDPGSFSYDATAAAPYAAASNHNTLTLAKQDIVKADGQFLHAESQGGYELIVTENQSYPSLKHRRAAYMVEKKFYVIVDEAIGTADGNPVVLNFGLCRDEKASQPEAVTVIDDLTAGKAYGAHTEFKDGNNMVFRTFPEQAFTAEPNTSYYSNKHGEKLRRKRYSISSLQDGTNAVRFITVICPSDSAGDQITAGFSDKAVADPEGAAVTVTVDGKTYELKYTLPQK